MTHIIDSIDDWRSVADSLGERSSLGFVPTMGALHDGHISLVQRCLKENATTVASIFVNPAQFNDPSDLRSYPRDLEGDLAKFETEGVDYVFTPNDASIYPDSYRFRISESDFSTKLCGSHRPGHFDGVLTVVMRLLNIIRPHRAYFGEKDYQQWRLVRDMVDAFFMRIEIVRCPTVREPDGLAVSSRNRLLSPGARQGAADFPALLREGADPDQIRAALEARGFRVDYVEELHGRRFGAVVIEGVRLIDNVRRSEQPET